MLIEVNVRKARKLLYASIIIYLVTSTPICCPALGIHWFDFQWQGEPYYRWVFNSGQACAGIAVYWCIKSSLFAIKDARYMADFAMELSLIDFIHQTFFSQQTYYWSQTNYILAALAILGIKLILNRYWKWFGMQNWI